MFFCVVYLEIRGANYPLTSSVRRWFRAWRCSPAENCVVLPQGFKKISLFDFVPRVNLKITSNFSVPGAMPTFNATFPAGEVVVQYLRLQCKTCAQDIGNAEQQNVVRFSWRTVHWKPACIVSCRTVQGWKRCAKRQAKPAPDRAR
jgi:hypothetical protein